MRRNVGNLDEITQKNGELVEISNAASSSLVDRARMLTEAVASIRLRQGSADEARALAEQAVQKVRQMGLAAAGGLFRQRDGGFIDRDLYVFVVDRQAVYRVHGANPKMEGRPVSDVPGIDAERFRRDVWATAESGGGWVDYSIVHPETGKVAPKASFVMQLDEQLALGCGVYRLTSEQSEGQASSSSRALAAA